MYTIKYLCNIIKAYIDYFLVESVRITFHCKIGLAVLFENLGFQILTELWLISSDNL